jgi:hypothetical protein
MEHEVSSDSVKNCVCCKCVAVLGHLVRLPNVSKCRFGGDHAPITHEPVIITLQAAVWASIRYYSRHTTQKIGSLYSTTLRKYGVAHY